MVEKVLRWFGYVPVARLIRLEDEHNDELLRERSERAVVEHAAEQSRKHFENVQAGHVRVIGRLIEDRLGELVGVTR